MSLKQNDIFQESKQEAEEEKINALIFFAIESGKITEEEISNMNYQQKKELLDKIKLNKLGR